MKEDPFHEVVPLRNALIDLLAVVYVLKLIRMKSMSQFCLFKPINNTSNLGFAVVLQV